MVVRGLTVSSRSADATISAPAFRFTGSLVLGIDAPKNKTTVNAVMVDLMSAVYEETAKRPQMAKS